MDFGEQLIELLDLLGVENSRLKVLFYFIAHFNPDDYTVSCTVDKIARKTNLSKSSAERAVRLLRDRGDIEMVNPGCWKIKGEFRDCIAGISETNDGDDNFLYFKHYVDD